MGVVPVGIKITRKLLDDYRRLKQEIPLLELELVEMLQGDNGFDNSTIFDYRTGEARPQSVVDLTGNCESIVRRCWMGKRPRSSRLKNGLRR